MPTPIRLDSAGLETLFRTWSIPRPATGLILFGLRGCLPARPVSGWVPAVDLVPAKVDHVHMRCTLGIWDPGKKRLFAAAGSTVPHKENVIVAAAKGGKGTNQLEPGFWTDLTKGEHLQGKLNGHQALRQTANRLYRRSPTGLPYSEKSPLFLGNPYDNLHCGWNLDGLEPRFRSAGCMVVAGLPHCPRHEVPAPNQGAWKIFHGFLYAAPQKAFPILLLPGGEALKVLAVPGARTARPRLVHGSTGEGVKALQRKLSAAGFYKGRADGVLGPRTWRAWNDAGFPA
jgi:hypothetical protein